MCVHGLVAFCAINKETKQYDFFFTLVPGFFCLIDEKTICHMALDFVNIDEMIKT